MARTLSSLFRDHPASVDETYWQHFAYASGASGVLFKAAFAALVHAVFPFACERTASNTIIAMHADMTARRAHAERHPAGEARTA
jgi:hypothetical protein